MSGPATEWRCFFCDEVLTTREAASEHFGSDEGCYSDGPACKLNEQEGGLLKLYNGALIEIRRLQNEETPVYRELYALGAEHQTALLHAEETGYARGLADGRKEETTDA